MIDMSPMLWSVVFFCVLAVMLILRFHIAAALLTVSVLGAVLLYGWMPGLQLSVISSVSSISTFTLTAIPLFILMGELLFRSGLALNAIAAIDRAFGNFRGRVAYLTVGAGGALGVLSGSAVAATGVLGGTLIPEMLRRGYSRKLAAGSVLGAGGLAMVLPPSSVVIVLGATAGIPVGPLLISGIIPGIMMAIGYSVVVALWANFFGGAEKKTKVKGEKLDKAAKALQKAAAREANAQNGPSSREIAAALIAVTLIVVTTLWLIIAGIATPTESAGGGLVLTMIAILVLRKFNWKSTIESIRQTVLATGMIFALIMGASIYSKVMSGSGIVREFVNILTNLSDNSYVLIIIMLLIIMILGMFLESIAIVLLTMPLFMPIVSMHGIDPIWFGIMLVVAIQIGTVTPPMGLSLFVVKRYMPSSMPMTDMYKAALPFVGSDLVVIALIMVMPFLATLLPSLM